MELVLFFIIAGWAYNQIFFTQAQREWREKMEERLNLDRFDVIQ